MTTTLEDLTPRRPPPPPVAPVAGVAPPAPVARGIGTPALIAGAALMLMSALAGFGNLVVVEGLVTSGDAARTAADISASEGLFRLGVASLYLVAVLDVVIAWALMQVFSPVSTDLSRLVAWFRLAYAAVFLVAISHLAGIPSLLGDPGYSAVLTTEQQQGQALLAVGTFHDIWFAALVLFATHLALAGYLALRSGFVPRVIGVLLVVAGAGYAFDSAVSIFMETPPFAVSNVTFLGEFLLGAWLLLRGRRIGAAGSFDGQA